jgi:DNA-binding LacI/PurR family transcriptional regulator
LSGKTRTIYDIAKEAGVSSATVSRVLTKNTNVSDEKRRIVMELVEKYQFQPNALAKSLNEAQTKVLGLIAADIRNPYYSALTAECEKAANDFGYTILLCNALNQRELEDANLEKLFSKRVDAIIQLGCRADDLISDQEYAAHVRRITKTTPYITTGKLDGVRCSSVSIDYAEAMRLVFEYLVSLGHTEIAFIGGRKNVLSTHKMWRQYIYLLGKYSLSLREDYFLEGNYNSSGGYNCACKLLELKKPPRAVIAVNDFAAVGALRVITELGHKVPDDFSLISFDNTFLSRLTLPNLTTADYDYPTFGLKLVEAALEAIREKNSTVHYLIKPRLIIRNSCAPPK